MIKRCAEARAREQIVRSERKKWKVAARESTLTLHETRRKSIIIPTRSTCVHERSRNKEHRFRSLLWNETGNRGSTGVDERNFCSPSPLLSPVYRDRRRQLVTPSAVAGMSTVSRNGDATQWITGNAFGCIVDDDESSFLPDMGATSRSTSRTDFNAGGHRKFCLLTPAAAMMNGPS